MTGLPAPYPLAWPPGRARTPQHARAGDRYGVASNVAAIKAIEAEVKRWRSGEREARITAWELTTNISGRSMGEPSDPAAALWFTLSGKDITFGQSLMVLACDRFRKLAQNIRAISLTMERLRLVDEIGAYSLVAAVEGARALPPPSAGRSEAVGLPGKPWHEVLGVAPDAPLLVAEAAYRALAKEEGEGGNHLVELNLAIEQARRLRNG
jgi:hypothetical protein